jgi:hypothetical protein
MWKEAAIAQFDVQSLHFHGVNEENHKGIRITSLWAGIWNQDFPNTIDCKSIFEDFFPLSWAYYFLCVAYLPKTRIVEPAETDVARE